MMRTIITCAALALTFTTAGAADNYNSANFILPGCKTALTDRIDRSFMAGRCVGIITTIAGLLASAERAGAATRLFPNFCAAPPDGVTEEQTVRVVVRYIEARPQRMHEEFGGLTLEALHDAWPCRK
jgi:hypothetical protein